MAGYIGAAAVPQATESRDVFTATSNQTSFATSGYTPGFVSVYLNGVHLARADYTASNGSDVVLASGATANDTVEIVSFSTFEVAGALQTSNNLSDLGSASTALTNLGVTSTAAELNQLDGKVAKTAGKETIWIPASAMQPTESNGCSDLTTVETTSGRPDMVVLDFDDGADEHAQFSVAFPKSYNLGTVTFKAYWTTTATDTDGCTWGLQGVAMNDNETIDVAYGTAVVVDDAAQGAAEELYVTAESGAITIAGTPADEDLCFFRVFRDVSDSNDDMAEDARLIGIKLFFTTDAANDA